MAMKKTKTPSWKNKEVKTVIEFLEKIGKGFDSPYDEVCMIQSTSGAFRIRINTPNDKKAFDRVIGILKDFI